MFAHTLTTADRYLELIEASLPFDSSLEHCLHLHRSGASRALVKVWVHQGEQFAVTEQWPVGKHVRENELSYYIAMQVWEDQGKESTVQTCTLYCMAHNI